MKKEIGVVGLGKMGKNIVLNLLEKDYRVVAYNRSPEPREEVNAAGAVPASSIEELVGKLETSPRVVWVMLPQGEATSTKIRELSELLKSDDIVIDGSNSYYKNTIENYNLLKKKGIRQLDSGSSGGPYGARHGMSLMIGGDKEVFTHIEQLFRDLSINEKGYLYIGPAGSGHFVKMVHNGIEYGMMQAIVEGISLVKKVLPDTNLGEIARVWNNGSVITSRLIEWTENALKKEGADLSKVTPHVDDTGEARWTVLTAVENGISLPVISSSLFKRFDSRDDYQFPDRLLSAIRGEFGGHAVRDNETVKPKAH